MAKRSLSKGLESIKKVAKEAAEIAVPVVKSAVIDAKDFADEKLIPAASKTAKTVKEKTEEVAEKAKTRAGAAIDQNGDGKFDQEDVMILLDTIYQQSNNGIKNVSKPVKDICEEYLERYKDPKIAAQKLIASDVTKCATSGFLTSFGGIIVLPVTIPANVASVLYVQIRMISSVAYLAGLDVDSDATKTLVYACLAGVSVAEIVKKTGLKIGEKLSESLIKKIPGKTLTAINQKVGFRLVTKFGEKGIINLGKMIPIVGGVIGGGFDLVETKIIANRAMKEFFDGNFEIKEDEETEIVEAEFSAIDDIEE